MCGAAHWLLATQTFFILPAAWYIKHRRDLIKTQGGAVRAFFRSHPLPCLLMLGAVLFLFGIAAGYPLSAADKTAANGFSWPSASTRIIFIHLNQAPSSALPAINHTILLADWQPSRWAGIAGICAFASLGLSTYALARRYAWPRTAITTTLLVLSMPRLVHQTSVGPREILPAAAVLLALLALYRTVEEAHGRDVIMLLAAITFSVSGARLCYLMPTVLTILSLVILGRRYHLKLWFKAVRRKPAAMIAAFAICIVFSQAGIVLFNLSHGKAWIGEPDAETVYFNSDGILGAAANMGRYLIQSIHLPGSADRVFSTVFGFSALTWIEEIYRATVEAWVAGKGAASDFSLTWTAGARAEWFGPAGFLLVLPALVYALWRGPHHLKTTALAMLVYWALVSLIVAWHPANVRLMTPCFAGSGFITAFFLPPWRIGRKGLAILQFLGGLMVVYTLWP
jgi:hypothetical protein